MDNNMDTKKTVLLCGIMIVALGVFGQSQPNVNPLITPNYRPPVPTQTTTATPSTSYTNHVPGSSAPYTTSPEPQQPTPALPANPPPLTPPPNPMTAPTITEPTQPPIPPPH
jgi:hypothetical protein